MSTNNSTGITSNMPPELAMVILGSVIILIVLASFFILLILPLFLSLIGLFLNMTKRYWAGILSILSIIYLWFDYKKEWFAYTVVFGNKQTESWFENGIFNGIAQPYVNYILISNLIGALLGVIFIIQSYKLNKSKV